eukprot:3940259-Rhodomonas_salina.1
MPRPEPFPTGMTYHKKKEGRAGCVRGVDCKKDSIIIIACLGRSEADLSFREAMNTLAFALSPSLHSSFKRESLVSVVRRVFGTAMIPAGCWVPESHAAPDREDGGGGSAGPVTNSATEWSR